MAETVSKKAYETAYTRLNPAQKKAVDSIEGPVMVVAGPGTGKTQILTLRIATILKETQANPEDILALTFTNSGVRAMRDRLRTYIGDAAYRVNIFTFHSFAEYILKQYSSYFPGHEYSEVITALEKSQILEEILEAYDFSKIVSTYDRFSSLRQVMDAIDSIKQEGLSPEEFEASIPQWEQAQLADENMFYRVSRGAFKKGDIKPAELKKVEQRVAKAREISTAYRAYQAALQKRQRYDFSDMILTVLRGLEESSELVLDLAERYQYLLIDEHQDTNEGQNKLIELITAADHLEGHPNLFTVGDEKQSIYRFQGASEETFDHFRSFYKDVSVIDLTENYRSTAPILEAAHSVIINSLPTAIALNSNQPEDKVVQVREFSDYKFELLWLANDIRQCLDAGVPPEEIAIIYRSNKHLGEIKPLLEQYSIPYLVRAKDTVLDDPRISLFLSLFSVIANPNDDHSLGKLLFADFLGLDPIMVTSTLREYRSAARAGQAASLLDFLRSTKGYEELVSLVGELVTYDANHHFTDTFKEVLERSGFLKQSLTLSDSRNALRKIEVLMNEMRTHAEREKAYQAKDFVAFLSATEAYRLTIEATATTVGGGVQCLTAHSSKGLEFEYVYVVNTTSKNWEKSRGFSPITLPLKQYQGDLHDERRLFYVAMTRAEDRLIVCGWKDQGKSSEDFWYFRIKNALERIDLKHENLEDGILRWTSQQINRSTLEEEKEYVNLKPLPSWVKEYPPLVKDKEVNLIAPSIQEDISENNYSPISIKSTQSFDKGLLIHKVLQFLPNIHKDSRSEILENYLEYNNLNLDKKDLAGISISVIKLINNSNFSFIFENQGLTEVPVMGKLGNRMVSGKIDRLIVTKDKILIIDYKTNINPPLDEARVPKKILRQMALYRDLICTIFPDRKVVCSLLWTEIPSLMELSDDRLNRDSLDDKGTHTYVN